VGSCGLAEISFVLGVAFVLSLLPSRVIDEARLQGPLYYAQE
jgi:hypothetical protein